jgi:hypothetical protein
MVIFARATSETTIGGQQRKQMMFSVFTQVKSLSVAKPFQPFSPPGNPKTISQELDQNRPLSSSNPMARDVISSRQAVCIFAKKFISEDQPGSNRK